MSEQKTENAQTCCPGGPFNGHRGWCASAEAEQLRVTGASQPQARSMPAPQSKQSMSEREHAVSLAADEADGRTDGFYICTPKEARHA